MCQSNSVIAARSYTFLCVDLYWRLAVGLHSRWKQDRQWEFLLPSLGSPSCVLQTWHNDSCRTAVPVPDRIRLLADNEDFWQKSSDLLLEFLLYGSFMTTKEKASMQSYVHQVFRLLPLIISSWRKVCEGLWGHTSTSQESSGPHR